MNHLGVFQGQTVIGASLLEYVARRRGKGDRLADRSPFRGDAASECIILGRPDRRAVEEPGTVEPETDGDGYSRL